MNRIYISGAITGVGSYLENFRNAEVALQDYYKDAQVVNPAKVNHELPESTWEQYMEISMAMLKQCDAIYLLRSWVDSKGAKLELKYAIEHDFEIITEE